MKRKLLVLFLLLFPLVFSACAEDVIEPTATTGVSIDDIYTSVANTLAAQASAVTPTDVPTATAIPTSTTIPTLMMTSTLPVVYTGSYVTSDSCYNSAYVSDVTIADGTELYPGESFTKTWNIRNSGTCAWTEDFMFIYVSGEDMDADDITIDDDVAAGSTISVSVDMVAPDNEGTYYSYWAMADASGGSFGATVYVLIVVTEDASTTTPTSTYTPTTSSYTSTPTTASYTSTTAATTAVPTSTTAPTTAPTNTTAPTTAPTNTSAPTADSSSTDSADSG